MFVGYLPALSIEVAKNIFLCRFVFSELVFIRWLGIIYFKLVFARRDVSAFLVRTSVWHGIRLDSQLNFVRFFGLTVSDFSLHAIVRLIKLKIKERDDRRFLIKRKPKLSSKKMMLDVFSLVQINYKKLGTTVIKSYFKLYFVKPKFETFLKY